MATAMIVEVLHRLGHVHQRLQIPTDTCRIGRGYHNDVIIDDPWVSPDHATIHVDEDGELVKSDFAYDFKVMDGRLIPTRIEIVPADEEGKKTVLYITDIQFDIELPESFFSQQNMKRIR